MVFQRVVKQLCGMRWLEWGSFRYEMAGEVWICVAVLLHPVSLSRRISYLSPLFSFFQSLNLYLSVIFTCLLFSCLFAY
jgi:hypothetical protein